MEKLTITRFVESEKYVKEIEEYEDLVENFGKLKTFPEPTPSYDIVEEEKYLDLFYTTSLSEEVYSIENKETRYSKVILISGEIYTLKMPVDEVLQLINKAKLEK